MHHVSRRFAVLAGLLPLGLLLLVGPTRAQAKPSASASVHADVLAKATAQRGGLWVACGILHTVGWVVYERIKVLRGKDPGARFVAVHSCPGAHLRGVLRLSLATRRPAGQPRVSGKFPAGLPVFYAVKAKPAAPAITRRAGRWLGKVRDEVETTLKASKRPASSSAKTIAGAWVAYGKHLALRYREGRVVALRANVALGMSCVDAAAWLGYPAGKGRGFPLRRRWGCEWPGISMRHRLAKGLAGRLRAGEFEIWQR